uniref:Myotubularin phosphatase domain-containing protein n=1 Tax=Ascaris lumbricoides TaxID=6252 RepID=A0A9J2P7L3_ASCLU
MCFAIDSEPLLHRRAGSRYREKAVIVFTTNIPHTKIYSLFATTGARSDGRKCITVIRIVVVRCPIISEAATIQFREDRCFRDAVAAFNRFSQQFSVKDVNDIPDFPLLHGEIVSSQCDDVLLYPPFRENLFGKLYCTNFRICFVPLARQRRDPCCSRSVIFDDDYQFPLCSIETLFYTSSPIIGRALRKFRPMTAPASQLDIISCIKICTKVRSFYCSHSTIAFNNRGDWQKEMQRCAASAAHWRICSFDSDRMIHRNLVQSYPSHLVVPSTLFDIHIHDSLIPNWKNGRFPIWCWSSPNGSAILRSSKCVNDMRADELWELVLSPVYAAHPRSRRAHVVDVDISRSRISSSFERLRELCSFESMAQFNEREKDWYSLVDDTGWCALVFKCLSEARKVVHKIIDNQRSVIITDEEGTDASAVVSSLAQICADGFYRTIAGLNVLIEKEWIALGHPFGRNMFNCSFSSHVQQSRPSTATFLLFLDSLSQLLRLFPVSFEYSQYMLIALWDLSITGLAPGLTCNSVRDCIALKKTSSTFPLSQYYSSKYCIMFANVVHSASVLFGVDEKSSGVIRPSSSPLDVEFWTDCYLRWVPPANVQEGGSVTRDVAMSTVLASAASSASSSCASVVWRQRLHPAFDVSSISSAFPYSDATVASATTLGDLAPPSDNSSVKSLRINFERGSDMRPTASKLSNVDKERRMSASSFFSRVGELVDNGRERGRRQRHSPSAGTLV